MKYINNEIKNFITIEEDNDPQRAYLIETFNDIYYETIMFGDEYHDDIGAKIEGFLEGIAFAGMNFTHRTLTAQPLGDRDDLVLCKRFVDTNVWGEECYIEDGDTIIELTEVE